MTECMPIASPPTSYRLEKLGCSGVICGPYLSIREPTALHRELSTGEVGAICVRGYPTFEGYEVFSESGATLDKSMFTSEGWFDTGDCGSLDNDGYLYITGRSKEIINKVCLASPCNFRRPSDFILQGGEVVSPFEIEEAVMLAAKDRVQVRSIVPIFKSCSWHARL